MKKYIGTKTVNAKPMLLGEFVKQTGRNPYVNDPKVHDNSEEGYIVEYGDSYKSWSPKDVFEKVYKAAETFVDRLIIEHDDLNTRFQKCDCYVNSDKFIALTYDNEHAAFLLSVQHKLMQRYLRIIEARMELEIDDFGYDDMSKSLTFGEIIEALKLGLAVRRSGWNGKGLVVFKQIPAHIESDIVPKMQSLPQSAKDLILKGEGFIDYTSQCLIYNKNTGRADSWVPSISDVFAEDWEIVM